MTTIPSLPFPMPIRMNRTFGPWIVWTSYRLSLHFGARLRRVADELTMAVLAQAD